MSSDDYIESDAARYLPHIPPDILPQAAISVDGRLLSSQAASDLLPRASPKLSTEGMAASTAVDQFPVTAPSWRSRMRVG